MISKLSHEQLITTLGDVKMAVDTALNDCELRMVPPTDVGVTQCGQRYQFNAYSGINSAARLALGDTQILPLELPEASGMFSITADLHIPTENSYALQYFWLSTASGEIKVDRETDPWPGNRRVVVAHTISSLAIGREHTRAPVTVTRSKQTTIETYREVPMGDKLTDHHPITSRCGVDMAELLNPGDDVAKMYDIANELKSDITTFAAVGGLANFFDWYTKPREAAVI